MQTLFELFKSAFFVMLNNRIRSILTMLGVVIGVFSVITLIALGNGIQDYITSSFNNIGSNLLFVSPGKVQFNDDPAKAFSRNKLASKHVELIQKNAGEHVVAVTPSIRISSVAKYKTNSMVVSLIGGSEEAPNIFNFEAEQGRFFTRTEVRSKARVTVIGQLVKDELFGSQDPIGSRIKIGEESFEIIGVAKSRGRQLDDSLVMPYTTAMDVFEVKNFSSIALKVDSTDFVTVATKEVTYALLQDLDDEDFTVLSQADILESINNILGILTAGLGAIAGISLIVGGIGIMNIMLVAVNERIREIGLRKAVGATPAVIGVQFMIEALLISVTGGMIGLFLGWVFSIAVQSFITISVSMSSVVFAFSFSVIVGVVFGTYPAYRASKLDPITALRHE